MKAFLDRNVSDPVVRAEIESKLRSDTGGLEWFASSLLEGILGEKLFQLYQKQAPKAKVPHNSRQGLGTYRPGVNSYA